MQQRQGSAQAVASMELDSITAGRAASSSRAQTAAVAACEAAASGAAGAPGEVTRTSHVTPGIMDSIARIGNSLGIYVVSIQARERALQYISL